MARCGGTDSAAFNGEAMKDFHSLSQLEILALAISLEEEDERVYADFAEGLRPDFPASAAVFDGMRAEESEHRRRLIESYRAKFGDHIPLIRRRDVKGFLKRPSFWLLSPLGPEKIRAQAERWKPRANAFTCSAAG